MWFNNALIYQYELNEDVDLQSCLSENILKPCPPHARFTFGFVPVLGDDLIQMVAGCALLCMGKEERILPRAVIHKLLAEKIQVIENEQGRKVKRTEKSQLAEDLEFELLPKSFCIQKRMYAILDKMNKQLIINASSANQASQLLALLRKTVPSMNIEPLPLQENLALRFAQWIHMPETLPQHFQLASDCLLVSLADESKRITCKGYELPADEILTLLSEDMGTAEISLIWKERIQLTLTHELNLKKIKSLDYLIDEMNEIKKLEEENQQQDASLTLLSGELRDLIHDLLTNLTPLPTETRPIEEMVV